MKRVYERTHVFLDNKTAIKFFHSIFFKSTFLSQKKAALQVPFFTTFHVLTGSFLQNVTTLVEIAIVSLTMAHDEVSNHL